MERKMQKLIPVSAAIVLTACAGGALQRGASQNAESEITAATAAWAEAYNSRNPARITSMYAPDAVLWGTTSKTIRPTPADIADYFKDAGKRPNARVTLGKQHVRVYGDVGLNSGSYTFSDVRDGQQITRPARFSMAFKKQRDGKWMLVDHHSSEVP